MKRLFSIAGLLRIGGLAGGYGLLSLLVVMYSLGFCAHHHARSCMKATAAEEEHCASDSHHSQDTEEQSLTTAACHCHSFHLHPAPSFEVPEQKTPLSHGPIVLATDALDSEVFFFTPLLAASKFPSEEFRLPPVPERNLPLLS